MQVVLVMFRADGDRRSFSITREVTNIGRREDCEFRIPLGDVSRKHCRLIKDNGTLRIEDLGSSNGTYCNGQRIHEADLQPGDTVQLGPVVFVVQIDGVPAEDEIKPYQPPAPSDSIQDAKEQTSAAASSEQADDGEFDPMSVLEGNIESGILPALGDSAFSAMTDSGVNEDVALDVSENVKDDG